MTVAAIILAAPTEAALAPVEGIPAARRVAEVAWAGGAWPIVVVAPDQADVPGALEGTAAVLAAPPSGEVASDEPPSGDLPLDERPASQVIRGIAAARHQVAECRAALIWPVQMVWVDPETVTSLIEAHGLRPERLLRPTFTDQGGWPALLPFVHAKALIGLAGAHSAAALMAGLVAGGVPTEDVPLGDPGTILDAGVARDGLPEYEGPPGPSSGHHYEWGAAIVPPEGEVEP